jgi:hypothetical protein
VLGLIIEQHCAAVRHRTALHRLRQGFGTALCAPCAILVLLRQEEFSSSGVAWPVTFGVSVYSSRELVSFLCLVLSNSYLILYLVEILGI